MAHNELLASSCVLPTRELVGSLPQHRDVVVTDDSGRCGGLQVPAELEPGCVAAPGKLDVLGNSRRRKPMQ
jgi:hypothetical protein